MRALHHHHPTAPRVHAVAAMLAALFVVLALVDVAFAGDASQTTKGRAVLAPGNLPERRFAPCGALDPEARRLVVFGGRSEAGITHFGDAWALDLTTHEGHGRWEQEPLAS